MPRTIVNLTPHDVHVLLPEQMVIIPRSGAVARCTKRTRKMGYVYVGSESTGRADEREPGRVAMQRLELGEVEGLPGPARDTWYLVSTYVAAACPDRYDLLVCGEIVRRRRRLVGCRQLINIRSEAS